MKLFKVTHTFSESGSQFITRYTAVHLIAVIAEDEDDAISKAQEIDKDRTEYEDIKDTWKAQEIKRGGFIFNAS